MQTRPSYELYMHKMWAQPLAHLAEMAPVLGVGEQPLAHLAEMAPVLGVGEQQQRKSPLSAGGWERRSLLVVAHRRAAPQTRPLLASPAHLLMASCPEPSRQCPSQGLSP